LLLKTRVFDAAQVKISWSKLAQFW